MAQTGLLDLLIQRSSDRNQIDEAARRARAAIKAAGDDPTMVAIIDLLMAGVAQEDGELDDAIARLEASRAIFAEEKDLRHVAVSAEREAAARWRRLGPGDQERAIALLREAVGYAERTRGEDHRWAREVKSELAWMLWGVGSSTSSPPAGSSGAPPGGTRRGSSRDGWSTPPARRSPAPRCTSPA
jgi:hypothetical protein